MQHAVYFSAAEIREAIVPKAHLQFLVQKTIQGFDFEGTELSELVDSAKGTIKMTLILETCEDLLEG